MFFRTLSGRFLLLTLIFVLLAEVLVFVPAVARFREDSLTAPPTGRACSFGRFRADSCC